MFGPLANCYRGIECRLQPAPGDVNVVFHTYHGFIAFWIQTEHRFYAPPDQALELLRRLNRFNWT